MRAPFQILVIPFRRTASGPEYAVLQRSDAAGWQFVAGGGEDSESPAQAAKRETKEEIGIAVNGRLLELDSMATIPRNGFPAADSWGPATYVIPEHCFAVDVGNCQLTISAEHSEVRWLSYGEARGLLTWDSNRNALWELNERLKQNAPDAAKPGDTVRRAKPRVVRETAKPKVRNP